MDLVQQLNLLIHYRLELCYLGESGAHLAVSVGHCLFSNFGILQIGYSRGVRVLPGGAVAAAVHIVVEGDYLDGGVQITFGGRVHWLETGGGSSLRGFLSLAVFPWTGSIT